MQDNKVLEIIENYDNIFSKVLTFETILYMDGKQVLDIIESLIPRHAGIQISSRSDVDLLISVYPVLYQKVSILYMHLVHHVRALTKDGSKDLLAIARDHRDCFEQLLKVIKLQYDSLSRRITVINE